MFFPLLFLMIFPSVLCEYRRSVCNNASTYKEGSAYSTNLKRVINDLSRNAPQSSGFNTSYRGQSRNKVYGLLQYMGNISAAKCSNCSMEANSTIQELCGNDIGGQVWMDNCFLRYDNSNFISTLDTNFAFLENTQDVTQGSLTASKRITFGLLSDLIDKACLPASMRFFSGKSEYSSTMGNEKASGQVYGLVQCWRDISIKDCRNCLSQAKEALECCCYTKQGAQAMSGSCTLRNEIYPFVDPPAPPSIPPSITKSPEDFNDNNKLGEGGFGPVYKGTTRDGKQIAVKKLSARSAQGKREFINEVELVANIQHRNLVNLLGCCTERTERLLVYEYLPNKGLDTFLFGESIMNHFFLPE
ncbi:cysteine-rich receptor-like protein kinase 10 [Cryptomeria japonica]|uniref:cysteine-rich receptor-like protein kinase 10 n=1 Tax=Cryptomeria japonica TaxID=3369 RepID=UPI0027DAA04B|nr:cysteine-rich receptor-like protein kinase 10 [Cryptomeria japonica]